MSGGSGAAPDRLQGVRVAGVAEELADEMGVQAWFLVERSM